MINDDPVLKVHERGIDRAMSRANAVGFWMFVLYFLMLGLIVLLGSQIQNLQRRVGTPEVQVEQSK